MVVSLNSRLESNKEEDERQSSTRSAWVPGSARSLSSRLNFCLKAKALTVLYVLYSFESGPDWCSVARTHHHTRPRCEHTDTVVRYLHVANRHRGIFTLQTDTVVSPR